MERADHGRRGVLLLDIPPGVDDATYWHAVADAWQDSDRQPLMPAHGRMLFSAPRSGRGEYLMTDEERSDLAALPKRVTI